MRTQQEILQAARGLFTAHGYARVTMSDIARKAGTATKTVYASVGTKSRILHQLIAFEIAESESVDTLKQLPQAPSLEAAIALVAHGTRVDNERFQPTVDLLYSSMASDEGARETWQFVVTEYRRALQDAAAQIVEKGFIAPHVKAAEVADRLWFCFGLNAWRTLIVDCQWSFDEAENALKHQAISMLTST